MEQEAADAVAQQSPQAQAQVHSADQLGISKSQNAACEKLQASSEPQHANAELGQTSGESQAAESQSELLSSIRDFVTMARDGIKQRQVALQYTRTTWQVQTASKHLHTCCVLSCCEFATTYLHCICQASICIAAQMCPMCHNCLDFASLLHKPTCWDRGHVEQTAFKSKANHVYTVIAFVSCCLLASRL